MNKVIDALTRSSCDGPMGVLLFDVPPIEVQYLVLMDKQGVDDVMVGDGTVSGLMLRVYQCAFAAASVAVMVSASDFSSYTAFCYLIASMVLQLLWSFGLACLDVYALRKKRDLQNPILVSLFVVGYSFVIIGRCMFISRDYSPVCKRLGLLQGSKFSRMQSIRNINNFGVHHMDFGCYVIPCHVLDLSLFLKDSKFPCSERPLITVKKSGIKLGFLIDFVYMFFRILQSNDYKWFTA
ncbi:hypothetical protein V6N12_030730 [Hibiscus sabdariffa]|uniref:CASP-like protein n=1 Tax=Hibiscus sabdariffa TaxID=183260 RepID=A0ABR2E6T4_9ROSI